jgi:hypothetical protein
MTKEFLSMTIKLKVPEGQKAPEIKVPYSFDKADKTHDVLSLFNFSEDTLALLNATGEVLELSKLPDLMQFVGDRNQGAKARAASSARQKAVAAEQEIVDYISVMAESGKTVSYEKAKARFDKLAELRAAILAGDESED